MSIDIHRHPPFVRAISSLVGLLALQVCPLAGCGGEAAVDVDQLVHDGPVAESRPPRPVALDRATAQLVRFSPRNGEISAHLAPLEGDVVDATVDGHRIWAILERESERRVTAIGWDGAERWSRPVPAAERVVPLGGGRAVVLAGPRWWAFEPDGGVAWQRAARPVRAAWPEPTGATVLADGGETGRLLVWALDAEGAVLVDELATEAERHLQGPEGLMGLSLRDEALSLRLEDGSHFNGLQLPWPGGRGLTAAEIWPGEPAQIALSSRDAVGLLVLGEAPSLAVTTLPAPMAPPAGPAPQRRMWIGEERLYVATERGVVALSVDSSHAPARPPRLRPDERFEGDQLGVPLAGPRASVP